MLISNLTVWESMDALKEYVYKSAHSCVLRDRKRWFEKFDGYYCALWWIPADDLPDPQEGMERLEYLRAHGDTQYAFSFKHLFPAPVG
jgi:hypothetical protein